MEITEIYGFQPYSLARVPLYQMSVSAGTPVPVDDEIEREIDLNEFLVIHPAATFFARVSGESMMQYGIANGDILVVDTAVEPTDGKIVVVSLNGEFTIKIFRINNNEIFLESQNGQFLPLMSEPYLELKPIGVVTKVIHSL
jgi:DNA polymerase V